MAIQTKNPSGLKLRFDCGINDLTEKTKVKTKTDEDKNVSISVEDPRPNLTESEILEAMNVIIANDVFAPNGEALVEKVGAKIIETETQEYDLVL